MLGNDFAATLEQASNGSPTAFAALYKDIHPALMRYLYVLAQDQADDVAAEAWLAVVTSLTTFTGTETSFRSWIFTIARNKLIDAQRKTSRRPTTPLTDSHDRSVRDGEDASDQVVEALSTEWALALIAKLPQDQAEAVMLRVVAGLDVGEAAEVMDRSPGAVRVLTHRGLKRLAQKLSEEKSDEV